MADLLLEVRNLKVHYPIKVKHNKKALFSQKTFVKAVDDISFTVERGSTFGLVGESGCGKSTTGKTIMRLLRRTAGSILFEGKEICEMEQKHLSEEIEIIFQDPYSSLDPRFTVGRCIAEPMVIKGGRTKAERKARVLELMHDVGLRSEQYTKYPHEFSGGQRQRIGIARALVVNPSLVVCDEPVSALDVSIQAQILNLMQDLQKKYNLTYIFISHNLSVVKHICDRIAVMYLGTIIEIADKADLFNKPMHPYTMALLEAIPIPDPELEIMNEPLKGDVPSPINPPTGCCFHTRCPRATEICREAKPEQVEVELGHFVACYHI